ncbi:hypothetical protein RCL1_004232 [Eukaryota sp. TZLM3-RCL]
MSPQGLRTLRQTRLQIRLLILATLCFSAITLICIDSLRSSSFPVLSIDDDDSMGLKDREDLINDLLSEDIDLLPGATSPIFNTVTPHLHVLESTDESIKLSFTRFSNLSVSFISLNNSNNNILSSQSESPIVLVSSNVVLVHPFFHNFLSIALNNTPDHSSCKFEIEPDGFVIISKRSLHLPDDLHSHHLDFPYSIYTVNHKHSHFSNSGSPFAHVKFAKNILHQAVIDSKFDPIPVIHENLINKVVPSSKYQFNRTAFVYIIGHEGAYDCRVKSMNSHHITSFIQSATLVRRHSNRRIIVLVDLNCQRAFQKVLNPFKLGIEVVGFDSSVRFFPPELFSHTQHRITYLLKCHHVMSVNKYLNFDSTLDRIVFLDFDLFPFVSLDFLFELDVPSSSLLGSIDPDLSFLFNSGLFVVTPGNDEFINWSFHELPHRRQGLSYIRPSKTLSMGEQESMLFWYRSRNMFHLIPPQYNFPIVLINNLPDLDYSVELSSVHFSGYILFKLLESPDTEAFVLSLLPFIRQLLDKVVTYQELIFE